jgi:hypothetical protein
MLPWRVTVTNAGRRLGGQPAAALDVLVGGLLGGAAGARLGPVMSPRTTRLLTLCWTTITSLFFVRAYSKALGPIAG